MRLTAALVTLAMVFPLNSWGQRTLTGKVKDIETDSLLAGAHIALSNTDFRTVSDENGVFNFEIDDENSLSLEISFVGYQVLQVAVGPGSPTNIEIGMIPNIVLEEIVVKSVRAEENNPITQSTVNGNGLLKEYWGQDAVLNLERIVPSILVHSESGSNFANYSLMRLRGIDQTRINITLNGIPLNDSADCNQAGCGCPCHARARFGPGITFYPKWWYCYSTSCH